MGIGIVGEDLEAAVAVHPQQVRPGDAVGRGVVSYAELRAVLRSDPNRIRHGCKRGLYIRAGLTQMQRMCAYVTHLQNPLLAQVAPYQDTPLLDPSLPNI